MSCGHFDIRRVTSKGSRNALWECLDCKMNFILSGRRQIVMESENRTWVIEAHGVVQTIINQLRMIEYDLDDINADTSRVEEELGQIRNNIFALQDNLNQIV